MRTVSGFATLGSELANADRAGGDLWQSYKMTIPESSRADNEAAGAGASPRGRSDAVQFFWPLKVAPDTRFTRVSSAAIA
jgi:hypothetical protein